MALALTPKTNTAMPLLKKGRPVKENQKPMGIAGSMEDELLQTLFEGNRNFFAFPFSIFDHITPFVKHLPVIYP